MPQAASVMTRFTVGSRAVKEEPAAGAAGWQACKDRFNPPPPINSVMSRVTVKSHAVKEEPATGAGVACRSGGGSGADRVQIVKWQTTRACHLVR